MPERIKGTNLIRYRSGTGESVIIPGEKEQSPLDFGEHSVTELISEKALSLAREKVVSPTEAIRGSDRIRPPLIEGARVATETLLGFLQAVEHLIGQGSSNPILSNVKVTFEPGEEPKLFVEGGTSSIWTVVAIRAECNLKNGFTALLPIKRAINVLGGMSAGQKNVVVGVDKGGFCLGSHSIRFGGKPNKFPVQPVLVDGKAQAALPGFYCQEIVDRVLVAKETKLLHGSMHQVLLDFELHDIDGEGVVVGTAVATDGCRIHILQLPRMIVKMKAPRMMSAIRVSTKFFEYLKEVVNSEWTILEVGADQITAKGEDFIIVSPVSIESKSNKSTLGAWREMNVSYDGCWMIESVRLQEMLGQANGELIRLRLNGRREDMTISSTADDGSVYEERDDSHARRLDGAAYVDVCISKKYFLDAVQACAAKMIRLGFEHDSSEQPSAPVVVRGEDEQFKAIVMPIAKGE